MIPIYKWDRQNNPNEELKYIDVVTEFGDGNGRFCYHIRAVEGPANIYGSTTGKEVYLYCLCFSNSILFVPSVSLLIKDYARIMSFYSCYILNLN